LKKYPDAKHKLTLSKVRIRELRVVPPADLREVAGGWVAHPCIRSVQA
jgi:hypothetical protein